MGTRGQVWRTGCQAGLGTGDPCVVATHSDRGHGQRSRGRGLQAVDPSGLPEALVHQWFKP